MASHPRYGVVTYGPPRNNWWTRFLADCRDLWKLIRGRTEERVDPHFGSRMVVELAKLNPVIYPDLDKWEAEQFASNPFAFWFDPERYAGTQWAFKKRAGDRVSDLTRTLRQQVDRLTVDPKPLRSSGFAKGAQPVVAANNWCAPFVPCDPNQSIAAQLAQSNWVQQGLMNAAQMQNAALAQQQQFNQSLGSVAQVLSPNDIQYLRDNLAPPLPDAIVESR